jgi:hypothetical protein
VPPGDIEHFRWALEIMKNIDQPLTDDEIKVLKNIANDTVPLFPLKAK